MCRDSAVKLANWIQSQSTVNCNYEILLQQKMPADLEIVLNFVSAGENNVLGRIAVNHGI